MEIGENFEFVVDNFLEQCEKKDVLRIYPCLRKNKVKGLVNPLNLLAPIDIRWSGIQLLRLRRQGLPEGKRRCKQDSNNQ
jgi:hypothetical protein